MNASDLASKATVITNNASIDTSTFQYAQEWTLYNHRKDLLDFVLTHNVITNAKKVRIQRWSGNNPLSILSVQLYKTGGAIVDPDIVPDIVPIPISDSIVTTSTLATAITDLNSIKNATNKTAITTKSERGAYIEFDIDTANKDDNKTVTRIDITLNGSTQAEYDTFIGSSIYVLGPDPDNVIITDLPILEGKKTYQIYLYDNRSVLNGVKFNDYFSSQGTNTCGNIRHILMYFPDSVAYSNDLKIKKVFKGQHYDYLAQITL